MEHIKISFPVKPGTDNDILIAMLADEGYDGFEETPTALLAYIDKQAFDEDRVKEITATLDVTYETEVVTQQNWNALWESNFQPVIIDGICTIRAHFHDMEVTTPYEIVITPKMSFGTGHHATTQLVIRLMNDIDLTGKHVLDFGTGTGVLAIMAEFLGATDILAIDNDQWCVENATENLARNNRGHITVEQGSTLANQPGDSKDVILANINRHILLQYMADMSRILKAGGKALMSGLLVEDRELIVAAAEERGLAFSRIEEKDGWIGILFEKNI